MHELKQAMVFLGHIISLVGLKVDSQKVEAIENWEHLKIVSEIGSFLSLPSYYKRFIEGLSRIALPLITLTKKAIRFE